MTVHTRTKLLRRTVNTEIDARVPKASALPALDVILIISTRI